MAIRQHNSSPDLPAILSRFATAACVLECAVRSLEQWHDPTIKVDNEAICLRHGLNLLAGVYDELDQASISMPESSHA